MAGEWQNTIISQVVDIISGGTPKTGVAEYWNGDIPWLSVADFNTGYRWVSNSEKTITQKGLEESATTLLKTRDIIISARGTVGIVAQLAKPMAFNQSCYGIRGLEGVTDTDFTFYALKETVKEMRQIAHGGVFDTIIRSTFDSIQIKLPPLIEQRAIAHILGALDDKIELNRKMNETLEAMAQAIFKSWFVDFDPVRAKAEGRQPNGLDPEIAKLFPDSFQASELGEIPKEWKVGTLSDFAFLNPESWSKDTRPEVIHYVDLANTKWGRIDAIATYLQDDAPSRAQRVLRPGDTIVGTVRPGNGSYAFVTEDGLTGSTGFAVLRPRTPECQEFVYLAATTNENIETLAHLADGGAYPAVRPEVVISTPVICPDDAIIAYFAKTTSPLLAKIAQNEHESRTLASLRDTLLLKLLSGEIRVKDAEKFSEKRL